MSRSDMDTSDVTRQSGSSDADARTLMMGQERPPIEELPRGTTIGRYVVLGRLGEGGMGVVYSAYDPELDRKVAIKVLRPEDRVGADGSVARTRFLREAQSMAKLSHQHVVSVYDVGTIEDRVFIAMEFVEGITLRRWVEREIRGGEEADVDWKRVVSVFVQAGRGLVAAHEAGIIHRDFKPENVMVDMRGRAVVLDFGLARPSGDWTSKDLAGAVSGSSGSFDSALTTTGTVMGTPNYMAPEQHRGAAVDERTDQFAFCVALYEALWGRRPFAGKSARELASNVVGGRLRKPPRSRVPARVERAVLRGLSTAPADRHPTLEALLRELRRRRERRSTAMIAGALVLVAATTAGAVIVTHDPPPCAGAGAPVQAAWDDARRDAVREAFVPQEKADGQATFDRVRTALDDWTERWRTARVEACEATRVRAEQSEEVLELRYACLDRQLRRFDALVDVLAEADATVVFGAVKLADDLPPATNCDDVERLRRLAPPPPDPDDRAEVEAIGDRLAMAVARVDAGDLTRAQPEIEQLLVRAREVDHPPTIAQVLATKARLLSFTGHADEGLELVEQVLLIGLSTGDRDVLVDALLSEAHTRARHRDEFAAAHTALRRAEAVIDDLGDAVMQRQLHLVEARVLSSEGRYEESLAQYETLLGELEELEETRRPWGINARASYAMVLLELDRAEEARKVLEETVEIGREVLGDKHPEVAGALLYRGRAETETGDHEAALASTRAARDIFAAAYGEAHANTVASLNAEGLVLDDMGRVEDARTAFERAEKGGRQVLGETLSYAAVLQNLGSAYTRTGAPQRALQSLEKAMAIKERVHGKDAEEIGYTSDLLGEALIALHRADEAAAALRRAQTIFGKTLGENDPTLARTLVGIGEAAVLRGDDEEARKAFTRALSIVEGAELDTAELTRARARFGLAQVLARAGQREQALSLAREAEAALAADKTDPSRLATVTAWLRAQG